MLPSKVNVSIAIELAHIFWPNFVEMNGSIFLPWQVTTKTSDPEPGVDATGMEALLNHTHMIDLFAHETDRDPVNDEDGFYDQNHPDFGLLCEVGKTLAKMWYEKLKIDFPQYRFRVYYTQEDDPIVRFHRVRSDEPYWLDEADWTEDTRLGKIIVYDTET